MKKDMRLLNLGTSNGDSGQQAEAGIANQFTEMSAALTEE